MHSLQVRWNSRGSLWGFRIPTLIFYGALTILTLTVILLLIAVNSRTRLAQATPRITAPEVLLDAGHGGMDGGAVSPDGVCEAPITLAIAEKTRLVFAFAGISAGMVREDAASLDYTPGASARDNKNADLNARLALARQHPDSAFLSIHLNQFSQSQYAGAQVFYSENHPRSRLLAEQLQQALRKGLNPENQRLCKPAPEGVFLMENIASPAVTIECGFLSNPAECALLQQEPYQIKIALAIVSGYLENRGT